MARTDQPLVKAEHIVKHFPIRGGVFLRQVDSVKAVNDVSLEIREGRHMAWWGNRAAANRRLAACCSDLSSRLRAECCSMA